LSSVAVYNQGHEIYYQEVCCMSLRLLMQVISVVLFVALSLGLCNKALAVDYTLTFDNFTPRQVNKVMVYATRFKGFEQYEILHQRSSDTSMHYQSEIENALLSYNFQQTFDDIEWEVIAQQTGSQFQFTFVRSVPKPIPYGVW
jgi:hypothetical protein